MILNEQNSMETVRLGDKYMHKEEVHKISDIELNWEQTP